MKKIMFSDRYGLTEAVLSGRKTQTRRIIKRNQLFKRDPDGMWTDDEKKAWEKSGISESDFQSDEDMHNAFEWLSAHAFYKVGEIVAVAHSYKSLFEEDCRRVKDGKPMRNVTIKNVSDHPGWTNKMFVRSDQMPHRIRITITNVRVERLQDISDEDCIKEGVYVGTSGITYHVMDLGICANIPQEAYAALIDRISGKGTWESNPYVFVYDFEIVK